MLKELKNYIQFGILLLAIGMYKTFYDGYVLSWFGSSSCPAYNKYGEKIVGFNANDFTAIFWFCLFLFSIIYTIINGLSIKEKQKRRIYIYSSIILCGVVAVLSYIYSPRAN